MLADPLDGLGQTQVCCIQGRDVKRIRLASEVGSPCGHLDGGQLGLVPWTVEAGLPSGGGTVKEQDPSSPNPVRLKRFLDGARPDLSLQNVEGPVRRVGSEPGDPLMADGHLPALG